MRWATKICFVFSLLCLDSIICIAAGEAAEAEQETTTGVLSQQEAEIERLNLPEDTSPRFTISELRISGNTLISNYELLNNLPQIYNASDKPMEQAEPGELYDLRSLHGIVLHPS